MTFTRLKIWNLVMKTAYLDCFSGISGDMFLGALLDAGLQIEDLKRGLETLPLTGYSLHAEKAERSHITGTRFVVSVEEKEQKARHLGDIRGLIEESDLVIVMTRRHREAVLELDPSARSRVLVFGDLDDARGSPDIDDPYGGDLADYRTTRDEIDALISLLITYLIDKFKLSM